MTSAVVYLEVIFYFHNQENSSLLIKKPSVFPGQTSLLFMVTLYLLAFLIYFFIVLHNNALLFEDITVVPSLQTVK